jgi:hypothetical protein
MSSLNRDRFLIFLTVGKQNYSEKSKLNTSVTANFSVSVLRSCKCTNLNNYTRKTKSSTAINFKPKSFFARFSRNLFQTTSQANKTRQLQKTTLILR